MPGAMSGSGTSPRERIDGSPNSLQRIACIEGCFPEFCFGMVIEVVEGGKFGG